MSSPATIPGRPREARVDAAVRIAVLELLAEVGYAGTTVDRIAVRAGVGKGAIYRRWRSKAELVFAVVVHPTELGPPPDTGSLEGDFAAIAAIVRQRLGDPSAAAALAALALELRTEPGLAGALDDRLFTEERRWVSAVLDRARARGERPAPAMSPELVRQALIGPFALAVLYSPAAPLPSAAAVARLVAHGIAG